MVDNLSAELQKTSTFTFAMPLAVFTAIERYVAFLTGHSVILCPHNITSTVAEVKLGDWCSPSEGQSADWAVGLELLRAYKAAPSALTWLLFLLYFR